LSEEEQKEEKFFQGIFIEEHGQQQESDPENDEFVFVQLPEM